MYLNKISYALFIPYSLVDYQKSKFFEHHCFGENILVFLGKIGIRRKEKQSST